MSRNLANGAMCAFCHGKPVLDEAPRYIRDGEAHVYFSEYAGMLVANATCPDCGGKYLAWCSAPPRWGRPYRSEHMDPEVGYFDLSFRSSFNDEPGPADLYEIDPRLARAARMRREADKLEAEATGPTGWEGYLR